MKTDIRGFTALVTGASSGLGIDFARELAARGANLVLVARRKDCLEEVAAELARDHGVTTHVIAQDLGVPGAADALHGELARRGLAVDILINNAGFGLYGQFLDLSWEREKQMLELDILALVHMTKLFSRDMVARGRGYIMQLASIGAYQPTPTYASYSAAKAFVLSFGEAVAAELEGTGVSITVVSPGVTATEFLAVSGQQPTLYQRMVMMKSPDVARIGVKAMLRRRRSILPGIANTVTAWSVRFLPRRLVVWTAARLMKSNETPALPPASLTA